MREVPAGPASSSTATSASSAYFILDGSATAGIPVDGGYRGLSTMGAGDFFGEIAALTGSPRTADVVADTDTTLLEVPADGAARDDGGARDPAARALDDDLAARSAPSPPTCRGWRHRPGATCATCARRARASRRCRARTRASGVRTVSRSRHRPGQRAASACGGRRYSPVAQRHAYRHRRDRSMTEDQRLPKDPLVKPEDGPARAPSTKATSRATALPTHGPPPSLGHRRPGSRRRAHPDRSDDDDDRGRRSTAAHRSRPSNDRPASAGRSFEFRRVGSPSPRAAP